MQNTKWIKIQIGIMVFFSILLVLDYFPDLPFLSSIPKYVVLFGILGLILTGLILGVTIHQDDRSVLKWQIGMMFFLLGLIAVLTLLGGESSVGIAFDNYALWVVLGISSIEILNRWRKIKRSDNATKNG
ncbi:hypothetical protein [Bacillus sp. Marseille-Q3570]|uniref:hypothetical protein n=1 Tax=Bacillus sp. Marseille-Q3570 TaxID=2963522 RepID=UPI0021B778DA|nr:hypothetical protein [Bacillus sp. Marseille-Q3570]